MNPCTIHARYAPALPTADAGRVFAWTFAKQGRHWTITDPDGYVRTLETSFKHSIPRVREILTNHAMEVISPVFLGANHPEGPTVQDDALKAAESALSACLERLDFHTQFALVTADTIAMESARSALRQIETALY